MKLAWDAASAAAGALMLLDRAAQELDRQTSRRRLPPKPVITPRITRLVRVPDLRAMHQAIAERACRGPGARACAVLVPSRGAAEALRRTLETLQLTAASPALLLPDLITRSELYEKLHERLAGRHADAHRLRARGDFP